MYAVEEVLRLTIDAMDYRRRQLFVFNGKGSKDRVVIAFPLFSKVPPHAEGAHL